MAHPRAKLSERLDMLDKIPAYTLSMSEEDRRFMIEAVREKEAREARQEQNSGGRNERAGWWRHLMDRRS